MVIRQIQIKHINLNNSTRAVAYCRYANLKRIIGTAQIRDPHFLKLSRNWKLRRIRYFELKSKKFAQFGWRNYRLLGDTASCFSFFYLGESMQFHQNELNWQQKKAKQSIRLRRAKQTLFFGISMHFLCFLLSSFARGFCVKFTTNYEHLHYYLSRRDQKLT